ncbi:hypothetical protein [Lacipirellula parvula]|uniref:Uncharacterized protein n=1 Tax=Lacipirellula parvula TaxID=2650471 RepID=A0A5K7XPX6_9BACT|nr:hypothetical protein [Lacipirellula parvula]BBO35539.1 hypothetical protein PLANPX_5151 [Lacipirellula parvula]
MTQLLLDAGLLFKDGAIVYDFQKSRGDFVQLRWRDTPENRQKLEAFIAERGLGPSDFRFPREHREDRSLRQRIEEDGLTTVSDSTPRNRADDIRSAVHEYEASRGRETWKEKTLREADEAEAAAEAALSEAERYAKRADQIEHATWGYLQLAFSDCPQSEMAAAQRRLQVAREGTPKEYAAADAEYRAKVKANAELAKANLEGQLAQQKEAYEKQIQSVESTAWVDATPTPQQEP